MKDKWLLGLAGGFVLALLCNAIEIKTLSGLPAHPLLLHMPVIFDPTLAVAAIVFALKPTWRKRYDIAFGIGAVVALGGTSLAAAAGGAYEDMKRRMGSPDMVAIKHHGELGETLRNVMVLLALAILIQIAIDRGAFTFLKGRFDDPTAVLPVMFSVGVVGLALLAGYLTYAAGHAGAKLVFGDQGRGGMQGRPPGGPPGGY
jgi:F420-0:gamma-glutamyl ligase-like protein